MTFGTAVAIVLLLAYAARIFAALLHNPNRKQDPTRVPRTRAREVADACAWPLTMFMSGSGRMYKLSMLRVMLGISEYFFVKNFPTGPWNGWAVAAMLGPPGLLVLEPLLSMVPIREMMLALASYFGSKIAKNAGLATAAVVTEEHTKIVKQETPPKVMVVAPEDLPPANEGAPGGDVADDS